jgi:hypothetical protein
MAVSFIFQELGKITGIVSTFLVFPRTTIAELGEEFSDSWIPAAGAPKGSTLSGWIDQSS